MMRKLLLLLLIVLAFSLPSTGQRRDELYVSATLTRGERSRDSGGKRIKITVTDDRLVYEQSYFGMAGARHKPTSKEFKLREEEIKGLAQLISGKHLLVTDTIEHPSTDSGIRRYFAINIEASLNGKKGAITIKGPTNAVKIKEEKLYQNSIALIEELYRIINLTDKEITYEELIN